MAMQPKRHRAADKAEAKRNRASSKTTATAGPKFDKGSVPGPGIAGANSAFGKLGAATLRGMRALSGSAQFMSFAPKQTGKSVKKRATRKSAKKGARKGASKKR